MTTETLEVSATEVKAMDAPEVKPTDAMLADAAMQADLDRIVKLGSREKGFMTRVRLDVGKIAEHRMFENCEAFAHSAEERPNIRSQTAKLIAMKFSGASGVSTDDKEVYRMVKAYAMSGGLVSVKTGAMIPKLPWSSLRVLVRWIDWDQEENTFAARFVVDVGIKDENGRTTRDIDATERLEELIRAVLASPIDKTKLGKVMDAKEAQAREGELVYLTDKERKHSAAAKAMADRIQETKELAALFAGFAQKVVNAKLTPDQVFNGLLANKLIPETADASELDTASMSRMDTDTATMMGKLWIQANNTDAIFALYRIIKPLVTATENDFQPGKAASPALNATDEPNRDPIGNSRKMHLGKTG